MRLHTTDCRECALRREVSRAETDGSWRVTKALHWRQCKENETYSLDADLLHSVDISATERGSQPECDLFWTQNILRFGLPLYFGFELIAKTKSSKNFSPSSGMSNTVIAFGPRSDTYRFVQHNASCRMISTPNSVNEAL